MNENLGRRLNKIAKLLDDYKHDLKIQTAYIQVFEGLDEALVPNHKIALAEAKRKAAYDIKQIDLKEEERLLLGFGVDKEAKVIP